MWIFSGWVSNCSSLVTHRSTKNPPTHTPSSSSSSSGYKYYNYCASFMNRNIPILEGAGNWGLLLTHTYSWKKCAAYIPAAHPVVSQQSCAFYSARWPSSYRRGVYRSLSSRSSEYVSQEMSTTSSVCCDDHDPSWWYLFYACYRHQEPLLHRHFLSLSSHLLNCIHSDPTVLPLLYLVNHISAKLVAHRRGAYSTHSFSGQQPNVRHLWLVTCSMFLHKVSDWQRATISHT